MKGKDFIGLALDNNRIYTAHIKKGKRGIDLVSVDTLDLPEAGGRKAGGTDADESNAFGFDDSELGSISIDDLDDEFEMTEVDSDSSGGAFSNDQALANYFARFGNKKLHVGLNIPHGKSFFQPLKGFEPRKMKKKEREEYFNEKLSAVHNRQINPDQYAWEIDQDGDGWLVSSEENGSLANMVQLANMSYKGTSAIEDVVPDEVLWTGMVRSHYRLQDDEVTGIMCIGERTSRLVFLNGEHIFYVLPMINEGAKSPNVLQTIFSKLLFEIDKGTLPGLNRIILLSEPQIGDKARSFFRAQFEDVDVDQFQLSRRKMSLPEHLRDNPEALRPYISAIGAAQAASGINIENWPTLSLMPEHVLERQQVFKLDWHGIVLLVLIALAPLLVNHWYSTNATEYERLDTMVELNQSRIAETEPIAREVEHIMAERSALEEVNERMKSLSRQNLLWSQRLDRLNNEMAGIPNTWLTTLTMDGNDLQLEGRSLYRQRIPMVSQVYEDVRILRVSEGEVRGNRVYNFSLRVRDFRTQDDRFSPEIPDFDEELTPEIDIQELD
ncbi:hypothetical protein QLX67_08775 [Balneolaceae bacterium ANBcel3]|nr:hypothetical protein [Balneolaceae bacterium ANBcel3]